MDIPEKNIDSNNRPLKTEDLVGSPPNTIPIIKELPPLTGATSKESLSKSTSGGFYSILKGKLFKM